MKASFLFYSNIMEKKERKKKKKEIPLQTLKKSKDAKRSDHPFLILELISITWGGRVW